MSQPPTVAIGGDLGRYRVEEVLGRGGMGVVYLATDVRLDRKVALKVLPPELGDDETFRARLLRESRAAAAIDHPSVIPVYEAGEAGGQLFIAMRYVDGVDLERLLRADGLLAPERALALVAQLAAALDAAHEHGLVHRDVKPSNALVAKGDHVYLCDFGLTRAAADDRLTATGEVAGTALYMAPETLRTGFADARSDLYSLGCVLFECLTGEPPFTGPTQASVIFGHLEEPPPRVSERRAGLPHALDAVLARALDKDPGHRYASGAELVAAARAALAGRAPARGRRRRVVAGVVALAAAAAGAVALLAGSGDTPSAEPIEGDAVAAIDPEQGALTGTIALEGAPEGIASGAGAVWVTDRDRNLVSRVDPETRTIRQTIPVGNAPSAIAVEPHGVWVADSLDGTVSRDLAAHEPDRAADPGRKPGRRALRRGRRDLGRRSARVCGGPPGPRQQAPHGKGDAGQPARQAGVRRRGRVGQQPVDRDGDSDRRGHFHGDPAGGDEPWRRGPGGRRRRRLGRQPARGDGVADRPRAPRRDRHGRGRPRRRPREHRDDARRGLGGERVRRDAGAHRPGAGPWSPSGAASAAGRRP